MLDGIASLLGVSCLRPTETEASVDGNDHIARQKSPAPIRAPVLPAQENEVLGASLPDAAKHSEADEGNALSEKGSSTQAGSTIGESADVGSEGRAPETQQLAGGASDACSATEANWVCPACDECNKGSRENCNSCSRPRDLAGEYIVDFEGLPVSKEASRTSDAITTLTKGTCIEVVEILSQLDDGRVRARIQQPAGFISMSSRGNFLVHKAGTPAPKSKMVFPDLAANVTDSAAADGGCPGEKLAASMKGKLLFPKLEEDPDAYEVDIDGNAVEDAAKKKNATSTDGTKQPSLKKRTKKAPKGFIEDENNPGQFRRIKPSELYQMRKEEEAKRREKIRPMVEAMLGGPPGKDGEKKEGEEGKDGERKSMIPGGMQKIGQQEGSMRIMMPHDALRRNTRMMILEGFRAKYKKMKRSSVSIATDTYTEAEAANLGIKDGHKPMPRPAVAPKLPKDFRKLLPKSNPKEEVPSMTLKQLESYSCVDFKPGVRMLVSVYGDIFDVSDRPDKYGPDGPYWWMTGHDLSWGFVSGSDHPDTVDKLYDYWKVAPESLRDRKLNGLLAWVAWYEWEYGKPVGILSPYVTEAGLKGPPIEDAQECCIM